MRKEPEIRMRLNTYKFVRNEWRKEQKRDYPKLDEILFEIRIEELEWVLEQEGGDEKK